MKSNGFPKPEYVCAKGSPEWTMTCKIGEDLSTSGIFIIFFLKRSTNITLSCPRKQSINNVSLILQESDSKVFPGFSVSNQRS
jgi:hypothetical protein